MLKGNNVEYQRQCHVFLTLNYNKCIPKPFGHIEHFVVIFGDSLSSIKLIILTMLNVVAPRKAYGDQTLSLIGPV
jgi:hypothetical protein